MSSITIELPDDVARSAQQAGLLSAPVLISVVRELVRERAARHLQQAIEAIDAQPIMHDELTPGEIQAAIDAQGKVAARQGTPT